MTSLNLPLGPVMVDIQGGTLTDAERARLQHPLVGGVILFSRNFTDRAQLTALCAEINALRSPGLLITVDHEGGRVQRFQSDGFTHLPAMRALGKLFEENPEEAVTVAQAVGFILAAELRACGVDLSFTPVLDLDYGVSEVIGSRSFHRDPDIVTRLAESLIHGLEKAGMAACGKHFPGHGAVSVDSHVGVPVDDRYLNEILDEDVVPYRWLSGTLLSAVMPAHVIYPEVDHQPAGFSPHWLQRVLRRSLAYNGVIFSDDLSMEGASVAGGIVQRAQAALGAGCDMVLVCNDPDRADQLLAGLNYQMPELSRQRIQALKPNAFSMSWEELQDDEYYRYAQELRSRHFSTPAA
ncbi:MAG TPA: beta-N-acetylhexosaminidase [Paenalcaligenes sp.]|nr:beta-N-acetylhexosaminidase [Paenalcaligenes sp.]